MANPPTLPGGTLPFAEACELVVDYLRREVPLGVTPQIAPDAMAVAEYAAAGVARLLTIGAYIGVPLHAAHGTLFGTLCGLDPRRQPESLLDRGPLLKLCATLLSQILQAEHLRLQTIDHEAELQWHAFHDRLTGLPNRAMFLDVVNHALTEDATPDSLLTVILIDLDDFTAVNDAFGHTAGDDLLITIARRLSRALRPGDSLARLDGDEFAVLTRSPDAAAVTAVTASIVNTLDQPVPVGGTLIAVSTGVGVTQINQDHIGETVDSTLARADAAMDRAKRAGKGWSVVAESPTTRTAGGAAGLREHLRAAIESGDIQAYYQSIDLRTGRPVGFEALARWCQGGTMIGPDVFIPLAARRGLLPALTERMLDLACAQMAAWSAQLGHHDLRRQHLAGLR